MGAMSYGLRLDLPRDWVQLPGLAEDPSAWAGRIAAELWAARGAVHPEDVANLANHMAVVAADSRARGPLLAFVLLPSPALPVAIVAELVQLAPDNDSDPFTVQRFAQVQNRPQKEHAGPPEVRVVDDLPAGPAVRVRRTLRGPRDRALRRTVIEQVVYLILPPALDREGLALTATWSDLALGDVHATETDALLRQLHLETDGA